jgi:hypothetical protein
MVEFYYNLTSEKRKVCEQGGVFKDQTSEYFLIESDATKERYLLWKNKILGTITRANIKENQYVLTGELRKMNLSNLKAFLIGKQTSSRLNAAATNQVCVLVM